MPPLVPNRWQRFKLFVRKHKIVLIIIGVALALGIGALIYLASTGNTKVIDAIIPGKKPVPLTPVKYYSPLTGQEVGDFSTTIKQTKAIMIENSPDARPQSGVKDAGVVFEAIAEGGITRFLCIYQESNPELIGPVRSLRPYYVNWLAAFDASVNHVGGSANALNEVRSGRYKDADQFFNGGYYWRADDRYAPHNVYTSTEKLDQLNKSKGWDKSNFTGFQRKPDQPSREPNAKAIDVDISYGLFNVRYEYDGSSNSYKRFVGGQPHVDREDGQILPKVAIVIKVPESLGMEDGMRLQMQTLGSGQAYIFQDGTVTEGTWHKPDKQDQIHFKDKDNNILGLNPGQVWITAIAPSKDVTWQ